MFKDIEILPGRNYMLVQSHKGLELNQGGCLEKTQ